MKNITLNMVSEEEARELNGGKAMHCKLCGETVYGNFGSQYWHCLKHTWSVAGPILEVMGVCFGFVAKQSISARGSIPKFV